EVEELPAMIWVVELVKALTQGLSAGQAQKVAQEKVRSTTVSDVQVKWLPSAQQKLSETQLLRVNQAWDKTSRSAEQYPFSDPVHWAPFILVGDPKVTVSPGKPDAK
ncbi:hypothetical protein M1N45_04480, partial [Dehalococcoidia bacterium]|nr:hypothetical protein [Dehalococcoidia bacterium]